MTLTAKILSLNVGGPEKMHWQGKELLSSMRKHPVPGPLVVHADRIEGNTFANPQFHGTPDSVLYAYGLPSALDFTRHLGRDHYEPGSAGETLLLDALDETAVSVGDVFEIGEVLAQATYPRIPCGKVDFRMQHERGRQAMVDCGRSGVYFRILRPGKIFATDLVRRTERGAGPFPISRFYELVAGGKTPTAEDLALARGNPAFPQGFLKRWEQAVR